MKKIKFYLMALFSLLLPSCSNPTPPSSESSTVHDETERLNVDIPFNTSVSKNDNSSGDMIKFPASNGALSTEFSGEIFKNSTKELQEKENSDTAPSDTQTKTQSSTPNKTQNQISENLLGSYSTKVYTKTKDRQKNLRIVCEKLSGTILKPNEEFSYNAVCGPFNKENGFGKATVFVGKQEKQEYGGGVCQLSSTLYNAVKDLNVEIMERHQHSKKVYYVPDGQDATVSYGSLDFRFKNQNDYSIRFEASSSAESVNVKVYKV